MLINQLLHPGIRPDRGPHLSAWNTPVRPEINQDRAVQGASLSLSDFKARAPANMGRSAGQTYVGGDVPAKERQLNNSDEDNQCYADKNDRSATVSVPASVACWRRIRWWVGACCHNNEDTACELCVQMLMRGIELLEAPTGRRVVGLTDIP